MSSTMSDRGAEVRGLNGVPTLFVDGVPQGPMSFQWGFDHWFDGEGDPHKIAQMRATAQMGIKIHFIRIGWDDPALLPDVLVEFDGYVEALLGAIPDAYIMPWIIIWPYAGFATKYPDDVIVFDDGRNGPWTNPKFMHLEHPDTPRYTWASPAWRRENSEMIARFVQHIDAAPYGEHIVGYFFFPQCFETSYFWDWDMQNRSIDYSRAMRDHFRGWLSAAYDGNVQALRRAWQDDSDVHLPQSLSAR